MIYADADFETRSRCDLKLAGAEAYSEHPTTEVICLVVHIFDDAGKPRGKFVWWPGQDAAEIATLAGDPNVWVAHNAAFEQAIWRNQMVVKHCLPPIPIKRWHCTLAAAAWKSLPLALEKLLNALQAAKAKDMEGRALTLSLSKPLTKKAWNEQYPGPEWGTKKAWSAEWPKDTLPEITDEIRQRVIAYCERDVEGEAEEVRHRIGLLHSHERGIWELDQTINQRGVRIDLSFVRQAEAVVQRASYRLRKEFEAITGGIGPGQIERIKEWCAYQGVVLEKLNKETIAGLIGNLEGDASDPTLGIISNASEDDNDVSSDDGVRRLPEPVRRVLEIRQLLGSASIKKLARMRACVCRDGRARGLIQYHAAHTGRWGGRLLQPQNFPRGFAIKNADGSDASQDDIIAAIMTGEPDACSHFCRGDGEFVHPIELVAASLRFALVPDPGKVFMVGDYAGIEMRVDLALAGQHDKLELIVAGHDVYLDMAEDIYRQPKGSWAVSDRALLKQIQHERLAERTIGKNTVLGCGFQMGARTFHRRYCTHLTEEFAERVVQTYRKTWAPRVPYLWYGLGDAALAACQAGSAEAYGVEYYLSGGYLCARLPSGWQTLWYPNPALEHDDRFDKPCWSYSTWQGGQERRKRAYGGLLTENTVQALARGLLCGSMFRIEQAGLPIVLTVHDEIVCEVDGSKAPSVQEFESLMAERSPWAERLGIPVKVEGWSDVRYRK